MSRSNAHRLLALFASMVLGLVSAGGCASKPNRTAAPVASTRDSEAAFREITTLWDETADRPTPELEYKLREFIAKYPNHQEFTPDAMTSATATPVPIRMRR